VQIWRRTSIVTTLWNYCYDHLLWDILNPGDSFIDFIAVSEQARYTHLKLVSKLYVHNAGIMGSQKLIGRITACISEPSTNSAVGIGSSQLYVMFLMRWGLAVHRPSYISTMQIYICCKCVRWCRGKEVGPMLMRWAEQTSESIMLREVPTLADGDRCRMLLRVRHTLTL